MAVGAASQNYSFDCKCQPPMEAHILKIKHTKKTTSQRISYSFNCKWRPAYGGCYFLGLHFGLRGGELAQLVRAWGM